MGLTGLPDEGEERLEVVEVAVVVEEDLGAVLDVVGGEWGVDELVELRAELRGGVGDGAEGREGGAFDHEAVDEAMAAGEEGVEELEFEACSLMGNHKDDVSVGDEPLHGVVVGIGDELHVGKRLQELLQVTARVATGDDETMC